MKKLLAIIILSLCFITSSQADDIRDFQIEGMSIGDSLLDYFSKKEIEQQNKKSKIFKQEKGEFVSQLFHDNPRFKVYEGVTVSWDPKDQGYELIGVSGNFYFKSDFNNCLKKRKEIVDDIAKIAKNARKREMGKVKHSYDKTGDSYFKEVYFEFSGGGLIRVICMNWSEKLTATRNWHDALNVRILSKKFNEILSNNPY